MPAPRKPRKSAAGSSAAEAAAGSKAALAGGSPRGARRVLLVDDDSEIVESMRTVLESRGYDSSRSMLSSSRHKAYAEMLGVDDYIRKPFAMDRLLESIDRLLST